MLKITDKIKIKNIEYMCFQILFLDNLVVYRLHEILGKNELFIREKDNSYEEINDKNTLNEIYNLISVKNTDVIISS